MYLATENSNKSNGKSALSNTLYLQVLLGVSYVCSFLLQAYLTRALGATLYGELFLADKLMLCCGFLLDGGYLLYASGLIERNFGGLAAGAAGGGKLPATWPSLQDEDKEFSLSELWSAVTGLKLLSAAAIAFFLLFYAIFFVRGRQRFLYVYGLFFIACCLEKLLPDFVYRGLQEVRRLLAGAFCFKLVLLLSHVLFVKSEADYPVVPYLFVGNFALLFLLFVYDMQRRYGIKFLKPARDKLCYIFKRSAVLASARFGSSIFVGATWLFLYSVDSAPQELGYFAVADLLLMTGKKVVMLFSESLYPYILRSADWRFYKRVCGAVLLVAYGGIFIIFNYGGSLLAWIFGADYFAAFAYLRPLLWSALFIVPGALLGYPYLAVKGYIKALNFAVVSSLLIYIGGLLYFVLSGNIDLLNLVYLYNIANFTELFLKICFCCYVKIKELREVKSAR